MRFREHKGSLADSLETTVELKSTRKALAEHIAESFPYGWDATTLQDQLIVEFYTYDSRCDWGTWIVCVKGYGVVGFTDGPLDEK